jgi:mannosyl-3-phosphoglycerate phosphatase
MKKSIIFTDLDGTLLEYSTYSYKAALPALQLLQEKNIPLIICSSKTQKEIEHYRKKLGNNHPFISENGGGIFVPKIYFKFEVQDSYNPPSPPFSKGGLGGFSEENNYHVIRLGAKYSDLRKAVEELRKEGFDVRGFGDMTIYKIAEITGISIGEAEMAKERDFDEPFIFEENESETQKLFETIRAKGFNLTQGRFFHIIGDSDKGKAVSILIELYKKKLGEIVTIAIGDSPNDIPMLERVDYPVIVKKPDGTYDERINIPRLIKANGIGPDGWNKAIELCLKNFPR